MTLRDKLKRCELVYRYVSRRPRYVSRRPYETEKERPYPTQKEIIEYVGNQFDDFMDPDSSIIGEDKEFRRLLGRIKVEYGICIKAGGDENTPCAKDEYVIIKCPEDEDFEDLVELYEIADSIGIPTKNLNSLKKMKDFIEFSNSQEIGKPEHVSKLLDFCIKRREAEFDYHKYGEDGPKKRKVRPHKIKHYQGRWYLIGVEPDLAETEPHPEIVKFRAYGLDRMSNLQQGDSFKRNKATDEAYQDHYADVIGIVNGYNYQEGTNINAEKISLRVDEFWWNYINASPWHRSQKEVERTEGMAEFELFVKPTSELIDLIIQWSPKVQVLKPSTLRRKVLNRLKESVSQYK